jgi:hypothetical protein
MRAQPFFYVAEQTAINEAWARWRRWREDGGFQSSYS